MSTRFFGRFIFVFFLGLVGFRAHAQEGLDFSSSQTRYSLDDYSRSANFQREESYRRIFVNLNWPGIHRGAVIASWSKTSPDYFHHWTRDAALSMRVLIAALSDPNPILPPDQAEEKIWQWISFESLAQNNAGLEHLGEPKYDVDGKVYSGPWARPQNDGPALRAATMMRFVAYLNSQGRAQDTARITPILINDLNYTANHWDEGSFDLWEEVLGRHFYTLLAQWKALTVAVNAGLPVPPAVVGKWLENRDLIKDYLVKNFLRPDLNLILPTVGWQGGWQHKHSNLDISVILAFLHSTEDGDDIDANFLPLLEASASQLIQSFQVYTINRGYNYDGLAPAIGRYPEDVYDGIGMTYGNPWFIATHAMAEFSCRIGNKNLGRAFLDRALYHSDRSGNLQEQFSRDNGYVRGAQDLTWSHASFITAWSRCQ